MNDVLAVFLPNPKNVGQSEYHAIYEVLGGIEEDDALDVAVASLETFQSWAGDLRTQLLNHKSATAPVICTEPDPVHDLPIWVVGGRFLYDDEDTVIEVRAADWDAAHEAWSAHMREEDPENENDLVSNVCLGPYKGA